MAQETVTSTSTSVVCDHCGKTLAADAAVFHAFVQQRVPQSSLPEGYNWTTDSVPSSPPENNLVYDFCSWDHVIAFYTDADRRKAYQEGSDQHVADVQERYANTQRVNAEREAEEANQ